MSILLSYKITVTAYSAKRVFNQIYDRKIPLNPFPILSGISLVVGTSQDEGKNSESPTLFLNVHLCSTCAALKKFLEKN